MSFERRDPPVALVLLVVGAALVVAGVALWSAAAAMVCGGLMVMSASVALAVVQEARGPAAPVSPNGAVPQPQEAVR